MVAVRYFVVQPFDVGEDGIVPAAPREADSASEAVYQAKRHAQGGGGAIAFSRVADPSAGEYWDAVILGRFGQVPRGY